MKIIFFISISILNGFLSYSQVNKSKTLNGYFIVSCFDSTRKDACGLNIITNEYGERYTKDTIRCGDGSFYKKLSYIFFVREKDVDLSQVDDYAYQVKLQKKQHAVFLSTNPNILLPAYKGDTSILSNQSLMEGIRLNQKTAEMLYEQVELVNKNHKNKRSYSVLMKISVKVVPLAKRKNSKDYKNGLGYNQYVLLYDSLNTITAIKVMKDPFK